MESKFLKNIKLFILFVFFMPMVAHAVITCDSPTLETYTNNLDATVSVGPDMPAGSVIYYAYLGGGWSDIMECDQPWSLTMKFKAYDTGDSLHLSNSPILPGDYYPTNIPGVGYMLVANSSLTNTKSTFTGTTPLTDYTWGTEESGSRRYRMAMYLVLVKTVSGPVSGNVNAGTFHSAKYYTPPTPGYAFKPGPGNDGDGLALGVFTFSGNIIIKAPSCELGTQTVNIGDHLITQEMKSVNSTTEWYDASVVLKNCMNFNGYYSSDANGQSVSGSGTATGGIPQNNLFSISVTAVSDASSEGYISLTDSTGNSDKAAKCYALQLGYTPDNINASPTQPADLWKPGDTWTMPVPIDSTGTLKIPLAARLIRTSQNVMPGPAYAKVIVSLSYK